MRSSWRTFEHRHNVTTARCVSLASTACCSKPSALAQCCCTISHSPVSIVSYRIRQLETWIPPRTHREHTTTTRQHDNTTRPLMVVDSSTSLEARCKLLHHRAHLHTYAHAPMLLRRATHAPGTDVRASLPPPFHLSLSTSFLPTSRVRSRVQSNDRKAEGRNNHTIAYTPSHPAAAPRSVLPCRRGKLKKKR